MAHKWAIGLHNPCRLGGPHCFRAGGRIVSGPCGYIRLAACGSPLLHSGGQNQKWRTSGPRGYITPAALGVPTASERGAELEVAHKWAAWLHNPCRLGGPHRFRAEGRIRSGPQVARVAT